MPRDISHSDGAGSDSAAFTTDDKVKLISGNIETDLGERIPRGTRGYIVDVYATGTNRNGYTVYKYLVAFDGYGDYIGVPEIALAAIETDSE